MAAVKNNISVVKLSSAEWETLAEDAHLVVFEEKRPASMNRIDYALVSNDGEKLLSYVTVRELDSESVYWQYAGSFPGTLHSIKSERSFAELIDWTLERYERISMLVKNDNLACLKLSMHFGFRIIGVRLFKGEIYVEMFKERSK